MSELLAFTAEVFEHYRVALLWQAVGDDGEPIGADIEWSDEAMGKAQTDVTAFVESNWDDVKAMDPAQVGHDFCLTRNGHGAGFWDRGLGELGTRLSDACKPWGTQDVYIGDDGLFYLG